MLHEITERIMETKTIYIEETTSTNSYVKDLISQGNISEITTVYTGFQTAGRGQRGNTWESEKGANLTFSVYFEPKFIQAREQFVISELASLAVKDLLDKYCDSIKIKWPNDVYYKDKKICGMLIENNLEGKNMGYSIAGIGININQKRFFSDAPNPISLSNITGDVYDTDSLMQDFAEIFKDKYLRLKSGQKEDIHKEYMNALYRINETAGYKDARGVFAGKITDVRPEGQLVITDENGITNNYEFKEVAYII